MGHLSPQKSAFASVLVGIGLCLGACNKTEPVHSTVSERLQPVAPGANESTTNGTIYVPVYSTLELGVSSRARTVDLAATVSVRNVSAAHPIILDWVRYYDSVGTQVREYLDTPSTLPPMGSVEFVIQRSDAAGGPGANFLIRWHASTVVDEPLTEAVMLGQSGNAGISFTSRGRALTVALPR